MKATKEQIIAEANRRRAEHGEGAPPVEHFIVDVVCENWTPPKPVDPDVLAFREWAKATKLGRPFVQESTIDAGGYDHVEQAHAYLAGARMAREQERERAKELVEYVWDDAKRPDGAGDRARKVLAKYEGTL